MQLEGKKAVFFTLGCKLNFAETAAISQRLQEAGVTIAAKGEKADICVVNTCSVTGQADSKCRQAIHKLIKQHPEARIVVTGCYAQLQPDVLRGIPGVEFVAGSKTGLMQWLMGGAGDTLGVGEESDRAREFFPACSRGDRTRYFLKVQDGCNYFCTYCTIPFARGRSRNGSIESLVKQAEKVAEEGGREIVITGVNIGDFGRTTGERFIDLIRELDRVEGIERYRISSIEPNLLTDEMIEFCAASRAFMPHFHIPLQSGCDEVLKLMHRRYDTALFRHKTEMIKSLMPDCFIGVDTIVGTRGETDEYFQRAYDFIESLDVSQLHVFSYSERPGTKALEIPHRVSPEQKHERSQRLLALSDAKTKAFYARFAGTTAKVLMEHSGRKIMNGFSENYIRVEMPNCPALDNKIVSVDLGGFNAKGDALMVKEVNG